MAKVNSKILDELKIYVSELPDAPKSLLELVQKLLDVESHASATTYGIDKTYDQTLGKFIDDEQLVRWCKNNE